MLQTFLFIMCKSCYSNNNFMEVIPRDRFVLSMFSNPIAFSWFSFFFFFFFGMILGHTANGNKGVWGVWGFQMTGALISFSKLCKNDKGNSNLFFNNKPCQNERRNSLPFCKVMRTRKTKNEIHIRFLK